MRVSAESTFLRIILQDCKIEMLSGIAIGRRIEQALAADSP